jgi:hypothetical protein
MLPVHMGRAAGMGKRAARRENWRKTCNITWGYVACLARWGGGGVRTLPQAMGSAVTARENCR